MFLSNKYNNQDEIVYFINKLSIYMVKLYKHIYSKKLNNIKDNKDLNANNNNNFDNSNNLFISNYKYIEKNSLLDLDPTLIAKNYKQNDIVDFEKDKYSFKLMDIYIDLRNSLAHNNFKGIDDTYLYKFCYFFKKLISNNKKHEFVYKFEDIDNLAYLRIKYFAKLYDTSK